MGEIRIPKQQRSIEKKLRIVEGAVKLFGTRGFNNTTTKEISEYVGVSVGTFYSYFKDKKSLIMEIAANHVDHVAATIFGDFFAKVPLHKSGREIMRWCVSTARRAHTLSPDFHREALAMGLVDDDMGKMAKEEDERVASLVLKLLRMHADRLRVTDLEAAARVVLIAIEEVIHATVMQDGGLPEERLLDGLADMTAMYLYKDPDAVPGQ